MATNNITPPPPTSQSFDDKKSGRADSTWWKWLSRLQLELTKLLPPLGTANQVMVVNSAATAAEYRTFSATGDATGTFGASGLPLVFATVNSNIGSFGSTTQVGAFTVNGKGLITAASNTAIAFPVTSVFTQTGAIPNLSGDVTTSGSSATTLASVNAGIGTFGSATQTAQITINAKGLITAASAVTITGTAPGGAAGGDLSGTYPNPTVAKINTVALGTTTATSGNLLIADGSSWVTKALSADATLASSGALTLATVNSTTGSFGSTTQVGTFTVNGKGLITAAANASIAFPVTSVFGQTGAVSNLSGDITTSGSSVTTLATVNANVGTFGSSSQVAQVTVNAKGLITAVSNVSVVASFSPESFEAALVY